jgi:hypothetical protein
LVNNLSSSQFLNVQLWLAWYMRAGCQSALASAIKHKRFKNKGDRSRRGLAMPALVPSPAKICRIGVLAFLGS